MKKLIIAKIICCGAIVIMVTVGFGVAGAWFVENGIYWLMAIAVLVIATRPLWKARTNDHVDKLI